ncbi:hypothetical protein F8388_019257 [Cannabis sativa]|uniref:TFIIS N-terminal domain-containing protein n=1 Tax=Cannabis sativa TaxID=3483 RepID=A0A7J6FR09_CANSA|nr:hypothetical protein G4B88_011064 [Cannabis sativa]KAF4373075.1 hypothetical protein F8388_019257 [Cannabis sativa]
MRIEAILVLNLGIISVSMTLEDFFTLTEMKDGLTALSRVEELITVMQKEKECGVKNASDATRQWTAVASTIAATENKDCLDRFINLDGLLFIDRWLKEAQQLCTDANESFVEESITALLQALEKLHVDNEKSKSSGIWITIETLLGHKSSRVKDRAKLLFDSWKQESCEDKVNNVVDNVGLLHNDGTSKPILDEDRPSSSGVSTSEGTVKGEEMQTAEPAKEIISSDILSGRDDVQINNQQGIDKSSNSANIDEITANPSALIILNSVEKSPTEEDSTVCSIGGSTPSEPSFVAPKNGTVEGQPDFSKVNELTKNEKQADKAENSLPSPKEPFIVSSDAGASSSLELMKQPTLQNNGGLNENDSCQKLSPVGGAVASASDSRSVIGDSKFINNLNVVDDSECCSKASHFSSGNHNSLAKPEDLGTSSMTDDLESVDDDKEYGRDDEHKKSSSDEDMESASDEDTDFRSAYEFSKPVMDSNRSRATDRRRSDSEFDIGFGVDALEVARRVAEAVEREVGDLKGPFSCSSSEKISSGEPKEAGSPDSINEKQDRPPEVSSKEEPTAQSHSAEAYPTEDLQVRNIANLDVVPENCTHAVDSSQVTEAVEETKMNIDKGPCGFDLNEELFSDEVERYANIVSTPVPVVSASRPVTSGLSVSPLQFEGSLGWKGSAATSAFRPASPRRNSDNDKNHSVGGTSDSSSKQRQDFLDIDLNVAEGGEDLGKQIPALSGLPSGESSVEASPKKSKRFKLDLNTIEDDSDVLPLNLKAEGQQLFHHRNGHRSPSPASSSSSMQPFMRNIDLNDRPSFIDSIEQGSGKSFQGVNKFVVPNSVISIMGTRVEINRKDTVPQVLSLHSGKSLEPAFDAATMTRTGSFLGLASTGSYGHSPVYGYNGLATGPTMSFSNPMYGPGGAIPCMLDSRGTLMPQNLVSTAPPFPQHPFIMGMANAHPSLNGAGPSRPNFDLNSGFVVEGGGNRDSVLRPFFISGQGRPLEEQLRTNSQPPSSSAIGGKRKEPDGGWEAYQFSYKQHQPPSWKQ